MLSCSVPPQSRKPDEVNILSLPDEALTLIFNHLDAFDTTGAFRKPRHAFCLAQTNTRLLRIFCQYMTSITPRPTDEPLPTHSWKHLISIIRLIGSNLRELHLPRDCTFKILHEIVDICPRLNKLVMSEIYTNPDVREALEKLIAVPIRSLSINFPTRGTLEMLGSVTPEELSLTFVTLKHVPLVRRILRNPPRKFYMELERGAIENSPELLCSLQEACPRIEEMTIRAFRLIESLLEPPFFREAIPLLEQSCQNAESKCMKLNLEGNVFCLLKLAHPKAIVEISRGNTTYVRNEHCIFPKRIYLTTDWGSFETQKFTMTQDLSGLKEIYFGREIDIHWTSLLPSLQLEKVSINEYTSSKIMQMRLHADTVSIEAGFLDGRTSWDWLFYVQKVEVIDFFNCYVGKRAKEFFSSIYSLMVQFQGKEIWIDISSEVSLKHDDMRMRNLLWNVRRVLDEFEARGGEAGTVREQLKWIEWT